MCIRDSTQSAQSEPSTANLAQSEPCSSASPRSRSASRSAVCPDQPGPRRACRPLPRVRRPTGRADACRRRRLLCGR
eukprot:6138341-Prymnesium_polylepis.1